MSLVLLESEADFKEAIEAVIQEEDPVPVFAKGSSFIPNVKAPPGFATLAFFVRNRVFMLQPIHIVPNSTEVNNAVRFLKKLTK